MQSEIKRWGNSAATTCLVGIAVAKPTSLM